MMTWRPTIYVVLHHTLKPFSLNVCHALHVQPQPASTLSVPTKPQPTAAIAIASKPQPTAALPIASKPQPAA